MTEPNFIRDKTQDSLNDKVLSFSVTAEIEMVSPRKRLLQTNAENRPKTQLDRIRNRVIPGYKIYLDLRNPPLHLVEDLKFFGAVSSK